MSQKPSMSSSDLDDEDEEADPSDVLCDGEFGAVGDGSVIASVSSSAHGSVPSLQAAYMHEDQLPSNLAKAPAVEHKRMLKKKHKTVTRSMIVSSDPADCDSVDNCTSDITSRLATMPSMTVNNTDMNVCSHGKKNSDRYHLSDISRSNFRQRKNESSYQHASSSLKVQRPAITIEQPDNNSEYQSSNTPEISLNGPDCYPDIIPRILGAPGSYGSNDQPLSLPALTTNQTILSEQDESSCDTDTSNTTTLSAAKEPTVMPSFLQIPLKHSSRRRHSWICRLVHISVISLLH